MWPNPQETVDLVAFTEENLNGKLRFLYSAVDNMGLIKEYLSRKLLIENLRKEISFVSPLR